MGSSEAIAVSKSALQLLVNSPIITLALPFPSPSSSEEDIVILSFYIDLNAKIFVVKQPEQILIYKIASHLIIRGKKITFKQVFLA